MRMAGHAIGRLVKVANLIEEALERNWGYDIVCSLVAEGQTRTWSGTRGTFGCVAWHVVSVIDSA